MQALPFRGSRPHSRRRWNTPEANPNVSSPIPASVCVPSPAPQLFLQHLSYPAASSQKSRVPQCVVRLQLDGLLRQRQRFLKLLFLDIFLRYPESRSHMKRRDFLTSPSLCTSFNERVYITAIDCEICLGTTGLQAAGAGGTYRGLGEGGVVGLGIGAGLIAGAVRAPFTG